MEFAGFLTLTASAQGRIASHSGHNAYPEAIRLHDFQHQVSLPMTLPSGHVNSQVVHQPLQFSKQIDKSTPKLYQLLDQRELISVAEFVWLRFENGREVPYYKTQLKDAYLVSIQPQMPNPLENQTGVLLERVSLIYQQISWHYGEFDAVSYESSWLTQGNA